MFPRVYKLTHACEVPKIPAPHITLDVAIGRTKWRCPTCGQRWKISFGRMGQASLSYGGHSWLWEMRKRKELKKQYTKRSEPTVEEDPRRPSATSTDKPNAGYPSVVAELDADRNERLL